MKKSSQHSIAWLISFIGGVVLGVLFARKKGEALRSELTQSQSADGLVGPVVLLKDEYIAMLQEVGIVFTQVIQTAEFQDACRKLTVLTKELLPRRESEDE